MIKIFSFAASCAAKKSHTAEMSDILAEAFREKARSIGEEISYECMTGADLRVGYCRSCLSCFKTGICPLDKSDDMPVLRQKMLDCDILFFGSPVYLWNMSGIAKSVLDRLGFWTHRWELLGKPCCVFASTNLSSGKAVANELEMLLGFMGAVIVNAGFTNADGMNADPDEVAQRLLDVYLSPASGVTKFQQDAFLSRVILVRKAVRDAGNDESKLWDDVRVPRDRGISKYVLMSEAIEALCSKKRPA